MNKRTKAIIREWVESVLIALVLALIVRTFIVQAYKIPTGSMQSTLLIGDKILVNKFIYRFREPKRGDIVVFRFPDNPKKDFIKRLIAIGPEEVGIKDGNIYIDGKIVEEPDIIRQIYYYNDGDYGKEGAATKVEDDTFYVLGDNSSSSKDSRYWGFVPRKNLIGKAFLIYWPPRRMGIVK